MSGKLKDTVKRLNEQLWKEKKLKAIEYTKYGTPSNLKLVEVEKPIPKDNEILVKVYASSINSADLRYLRADPFFVRLMGQGLLRPKVTILGVDIAGKVEAIGKNITRYHVGDEVYGEIFDSGMGGFAQYKCVPEDESIAIKPINMTFEQAATVPVAGITAIQGLRDFGHIKTGQKVLINGASGGVGSFAVLFAKAYGSTVTGVCSTKSMDMVRSIGADIVIDYKKEDFTKNGEQYDLIFDVAANRSVADIKNTLAPNGVCVVAGFSLIPKMLKLTLQGSKVSKKRNIEIGHMGSSKPSNKELDFLRELMENYNIVPAIDRTYPLNETAEAMRYFEDEHAKAKVVITIDHEE